MTRDAWVRARFESVRALRFLLHTLRLRYFCSGKIHKFCCKIASMHAELTLFVTPSLKVSWLPSEVYVLSGDLSKRALSFGACQNIEVSKYPLWQSQQSSNERGLIPAAMTQ